MPTINQLIRIGRESKKDKPTAPVIGLVRKRVE
jgi:hypothetical protein